MACFHAAHYEHDADPGKRYRDEIIAAKKQLVQLARAARVIAQNARHQNTGLKWALVKAETESGIRLTRKSPEGEMALTQVAERYFDCLEAALRGPLPELSGGPFLRRFTIGNLHFEKPISAGRPVTVASMLAFELTIYLRMHTAGHAEDVLQFGTPMPKYGDPSFPVVAAFCEAALDSALDAKQVGDNVRKMKNVGLVPWPGTD